MRGKVRTVEEKIAAIASRAWGIVTRAELLAAGLTGRQIEERLRKGSLIAVFRGVYRVGHAAPSTEATYMAAVKACGKGAALSGLAAAYLYGLLKGKPPSPEVTAPREKSIPGIATQRASLVGETMHWKRIPITTVPRTIVDIAARLDVEELGRACHQAGVRFKTTPRQVDQVLARRPRAPGARNLRRIIHGDERITLSKLERLFLERVRDARLPLPQTNRIVDGQYVDCRWPEHALTVELHGYRFHNSRHSWEDSHRRRRAARARGDEFAVYTWTDVHEQPEPMLAELRAQLVSASRTP